MKKLVVFGLLGISFLFSPRLALATIQVALENPGNGTSANGATAISGWAFSDTGATVTVRLRVNGETQIVIPCCGPRQDVQNVFPAAPASVCSSTMVSSRPASIPLVLKSVLQVRIR